MNANDPENEEDKIDDRLTPAFLAAGMGSMDGPGSIASGPFGVPQGAAAAVALAMSMDEEEPVNPPVIEEEKEKTEE